MAAPRALSFWDVAQRVLCSADYWLSAAALFLLVMVASSGVAPSFSVAEALWIWVILLGLRFATSNLTRALADRAYIRRERLNGGRQVVADGHVRREILRLVGLSALLLLGVYASTPTEWRPRSSTWFPALCIIACGVSMTVNSKMDSDERDKFLRTQRVEDVHQRLREAIRRVDEEQAQADARAQGYAAGQVEGHAAEVRDHDAAHRPHHDGEHAP